jgi:hypothetical protein
MGDWWFAVFWILLIPLIIAEVIIFVKSRKFFWLVYALSVFTYIIAVSYMIDVYDLGKNAVILILLASAVLMFLIGKQLGRKPSERISGAERNSVIILAAIMAIIFIVSVIFGKLSETVKPIPVKESDLLRTYDENGYAKPGVAEVRILQRTLANRFFLPVPVQSRNYRTCLVTSTGVSNLDSGYSYSSLNEEVGAGETKTLYVTISPFYYDRSQQIDAKELLVYVEDNSYSYAPCDSITKEPDFHIPVE